MSTLSLDTLGDFIGQEIGVSGWETIDQPRIDAFAHNTGDRQWIHVDPERARRESPYGGTIAHGYLLLSLLAPATLELLIQPAGITTAINYGMDRLRFMAPVKAGARVRDRITLVGAEDKGGGRILITTGHTLEIEGEAKPALVAQVLSMAMR